MPWHTGLTCNQYNTRERERLQQEEASLQLMEKATKQCPQCQVRIEKNDGCDHMTCRSCKHEFCWICFVDYELIRSRDNSAHTPTCPYYVGVPLRYQAHFPARPRAPVSVDHYIARARPHALGRYEAEVQEY
ncbi:hypothetical protein sscle_08g064420 [Sclerotinia sclerotiorum 1980 UF-70]|uniref:RBR-type E3 ubiquitin transferase n=1 Tax=Sclerotinia sclerotiorum (strain ATCC 18683 / 1980 / Ss-1) TaxID=665079 RepID=A0A1D9QA86_SCLS1|nr:hypothetical protein sscle_08g064420 [Sclerotinia sclerotiorum 1980 UF-70]